MEFYTKYAIFQGRTEIDQLELIYKLCGTPTIENWPAIKDMAWHGLLNFPPCERVLVKEFSNPSYGLTPKFLELIDSLLSLDPLKRPTAKSALKHPFFTEEKPIACLPSQYFFSY
jgi:serine/threonine protein kinase